jgi:hypothetical protein
MEENTASTSSKIRKDYLTWYNSEKAKGLKDIKFYPADVGQATVDSFISESVSIDQAIADKRHSPLPSTI